MTIDTLIKVLQASVAPVVLISGIGLLLLTMTNRLSRTIDRIRLLCDEFPRAIGEKQHLRSQIEILFRRCRLLQKAIAAATFSIMCVSVVILLLFLMYTLEINLTLDVQVLFTISLGALIVSLIYFLIDVRVTLNSLKIDMEQALSSTR